MLKLRRASLAKSRLDAFHDIILSWIAVQPDLTLAEMSARFADEHGLRVPVAGPYVAQGFALSALA